LGLKGLVVVVVVVIKQPSHYIIHEQQLQLGQFLSRVQLNLCETENS
jgi:hypothetical protein